MPVLTWRNVDAPNFGAAIQGKNAAAQLIGGAFNDLSQGLGQFQKNTQNDADAAALRGLIGIKDPTQFDQQLANANLTNVSTGGLKTLAGRGSQLLQQAALGQKMADDKYDQNRKVSLDGINDAARPGVAAILNAQAQGNPDLINQAYAQHGAAIAQLSQKEQESLAAQGLSLNTGRLNNDNRSFQNRTQLRDDNAQQAAYQIADQVRTNTDPSDLLSQQGMIDEADGTSQARALAVNMLGNPYLAGRTAATTGSGARAPAGKAGAAIAGAAGGGDTFSRMLSRESDGRQFNDDGSVVTSSKGATGRAQIMPSTGPEAAQLAGVEWDPDRFKNDPQYNTALGAAYFAKQQATFGNDAQAAAAYNAGPQRVKDAIAAAAKEGNPDAWLSKLPKETRDYVPAVTGGQDTTSEFAVGNDQVVIPTVSGAESQAAKIGVQDRLAQNQSRNISADYAQTMQSTDTPGKVVNDLIASDFPDADRGKLLGKINEVMTQAGVNAPTAAAMIKRTASPASTYNPLSRNFRGTTDLGGGVGFNDNALAAETQSVKTGLSNDQLIANDLTKAVGQNIQSAQDEVTAANAALTDHMTKVAARPTLSAQTPRLEARLRSATKKLQDAIQKQRQEPAFASRRIQEAVQPEAKNRDMNIPDPKSLAQPDIQLTRARDFGLYD